ncbi:MAG: panthothenate synthetase [Candidatus Latescibacterota bacterium]|nr:MAG: panthothenate synthetase [Candidatus Latescibacterota bacterium]
MRMLVHVKIPNDEFNDAVRDGTAGEKMHDILEDAKPEAVYFTEYDGQRGAVMVVDVKDPSDVPKLAEPWFLLFDAEVEFHVAMTPQDLEKANLNKLNEKWSD